MGWELRGGWLLLLLGTHEPMMNERGGGEEVVRSTLLPCFAHNTHASMLASLLLCLYLFGYWDSSSFALLVTTRTRLLIFVVYFDKCG